MSHELKTPVHSIILMAELILMESDSLRVPEALERQREAANHIHGAAGALLNLVDGIVSAAQLEHPETREMRIATFDLRPIVAEAIERVAHMAYHRRLRLYHVIQADVPVHLRGDSRGLRIILNNLLDNAIKFTEQGSVALEVRLDEDSDDQGALCFDVRDTGIGIPPEEHVRIFEAFTQINTGGKRTHAGTGVGLGAVKRESESMGGCVTLHSAPGQGACFTLHAAFDVVEERDMTDEHIAPPEIRLALLLCGDDPDARRAIETSLALVAIEPVRVLDLDCFKAQGMAALSGADAVLVEQASLRADDLNALRHADTGRRWLSLEFMDAPNDLASVRDRTGIEPYPFSVILSVERLRKALGIDASSQKMNRHSASREVDGMRVLVVDDSPAAPVVLARFLSKWGVNLFTAESGFEAIRFLQKNEPVDLILMDIQMPEIDGFATLAELRARGLLGPAKIYASTAGNLPDVQRRIEASAFDGALNKPFSANGLLDVLVSVARTAPPAAEAINDAAVRAEIRQAFILEIPDQRALGERLRSCDNAEALAAWVHKVAGMAAMSGIEPMAAELYDLEQRLKSEKVAQGECNIIWEVVMKWLDDVEKEAGAGSAV
jgi:CheY-like chemotaxis protein/HPt (histidine-containing phosphotransfer) domain-containing protein